MIARAAVNRLVLDGCTLDPGGAWQLDGTADGTRQDPRPGFALAGDYDFSGAELALFEQVPQIDLFRSISGAILAEEDAYTLTANGSIVDGGSGVGDDPANLAIGSLSDPVDGYGPALSADGLTVFGRTRVARASGQGGIWLHSLRAHDNQKGCIRFSYFSGVDDRLPPHFACVLGPDIDIGFTDERFGMPGYAQLRRRSDQRILEQGPARDMMGAFGYLKNTHKFKNLTIRFREFMPVGITRS